MATTPTTTPVRVAAADVLAQRRIAVTGVSRTPRGHGANTVYTWLRDHGYEVFAVNPHATEVQGDPAYPTVQAVPGGVDAVVVATSAAHALESVEESLDSGVRRLWLHRSTGTGSVSPEAVERARAAGATVIAGGCPIMFHPDGDGVHHVMCRVLTWTGAVPRAV
ncbi:CoA-binding protein [Phycicoccus sp. MAQZ13P-2]|uniref:CoA-binding protein n=1 Tax=Phycicoccus mangrovi TaxID=2840470 RepID=UPI001C00176E|nr:CoA-binding protein [Phycicoccus mangrovi]MBT9255704.1 CoA-binding protein [Phycicoccus mangrovi]MBT9274298.1 CoA-binding protein [Phycicoccus mangrovi]